MKTDGTEFFYMDENNQNFKITNARNIAKTNVNPLFETLKPIYAKVSTKKHHFFLWFKMFRLNPLKYVLIYMLRTFTSALFSGSFLLLETKYLKVEEKISICQYFSLSKLKYEMWKKVLSKCAIRLFYNYVSLFLNSNTFSLCSICNVWFFYYQNYFFEAQVINSLILFTTSPIICDV